MYFWIFRNFNKAFLFQDLQPLTLSTSTAPVTISAHQSDLACMSMNVQGTLLATASVKVIFLPVILRNQLRSFCFFRARWSGSSIRKSERCWQSSEEDPIRRTCTGKSKSFYLFYCSTIRALFLASNSVPIQPSYAPLATKAPFTYSRSKIKIWTGDQRK